MSTTDGDEYECPCGKHFKRKPTYDRHMEIAHSHTAHYKCQQCGKTFGNENTLTMHMSVHENKQSFVKLTTTRSTRSRSKNAKNDQNEGVLLDQKTKEKEKENVDRNSEKRMKTRSDDKAKCAQEKNIDITNVSSKKSDFQSIRKIEHTKQIDNITKDTEKSNHVTKESYKSLDATKDGIKFEDTVGDEKLTDKSDPKSNNKYTEINESAKDEIKVTSVTDIVEPSEQDIKNNITLSSENKFADTVFKEGGKLNGLVSCGQVSVQNAIDSLPLIGSADKPTTTATCPVAKPRLSMGVPATNTGQTVTTSSGVGRDSNGVIAPPTSQARDQCGHIVAESAVATPMSGSASEAGQTITVRGESGLGQVTHSTQMHGVMPGTTHQLTHAIVQHAASTTAAVSTYAASLPKASVVQSPSQGPHSQEMRIREEDDYEDLLDGEEAGDDDKQATRKSHRRRTANPIWQSLITGKVYDEVLDTLDDSPERKKIKRADSMGSNIMATDEPFEDLTLLPVDINNIKTEIDDTFYSQENDTDPDSPKRGKKLLVAKRRSSTGNANRGHGGKGISAFECYVCGKGFISEKYLSMHISLHMSAGVKTEVVDPAMQQQHPGANLGQLVPPAQLSPQMQQFQTPMECNPATQNNTVPQNVASNNNNNSSSNSSNNSNNNSSGSSSNNHNNCINNMSPPAPMTPSPQMLQVSQNAQLVKVVQNNSSPATHTETPNKIAKKGKKGTKSNGEGGWTCALCSKTFAHNSGYKNHMRTHSNERPYVCTICDIGFKEKYHLKKHNLFIHSTEMPEKCKVCGKRFKDSTAVRAHERIHSDERPFSCRRCNKSFKTSECLWHHEHRSKTCGQALVDTIAQDRLVRKRRKFPKSGSQSEDSQDQDDNKLVNVKEEPEFDLEDDIQPEEAELLLNGEFTKPEFDESLINSIASSLDTANCLDQIPVMVKNEKEVPFLYNTPSPIPSSEKYEHMYENDNAYPNDHIINNLDYIDPNVNVQKEKEKPYKCSLCTKGFSDLAAFQRHSKVHTEERPFVCTKCDIGFKMKVHLKKHNLYVHSDDYPCECQHCGKRFKDSSAVKLHERTHSDNRPFQCMGCGKAFKTRENLWGHQHRGKCTVSKEGELPTNMPKSAQASVDNMSAHASVDNKQGTAKAYVSTSQVTARAVIENNHVTAHATFANNHVTAHASVINNQLTAHASIMNNQGTVAQASVANVCLQVPKDGHFAYEMKSNEHVFQNGHFHPATPPGNPVVNNVHVSLSGISRNGQMIPVNVSSQASIPEDISKEGNMHYSQAKIARSSPIMSTTLHQPIVNHSGATTGVPVTSMQQQTLVATGQSSLSNNSKWPTLKDFLFQTIGPIKEPPSPQQAQSPGSQLGSQTPPKQNSQVSSPLTLQQIPTSAMAAQQETTNSLAHQQMPQTPLVSQPMPPTTMAVQSMPQTSVGQMPPTTRAEQQLPSASGASAQQLPSTTLPVHQMPPTTMAGQQVPVSTMAVQQMPAFSIAAQQMTATTMAVQQMPQTSVATQQMPQMSVPQPQASNNWYNHNAKVLQNNNNITTDPKPQSTMDYPALKERLTRSFLGQITTPPVTTSVNQVGHSTQAQVPVTNYGSQPPSFSNSISGGIPSFQSTFLSKGAPPPPLNILQNPSPMMRNEDPSIPIIYWDDDHELKGSTNQWHGDTSDAMFHDISESVFTQL